MDSLDIKKRVVMNRYEESESFEAQAVRYISALLLLDGKLLPFKLGVYQEFLSLFFGENEILEDVEFQQFFFERLLNENGGNISFQDLAAALEAKNQEYEACAEKDIEEYDRQIEILKNLLAEYSYEALATLTHKVSYEYIEEVRYLIESWGASPQELIEKIPRLLKNLPPDPDGGEVTGKTIIYKELTGFFSSKKPAHAKAQAISELEVSDSEKIKAINRTTRVCQFLERINKAVMVDDTLSDRINNLQRKASSAGKNETTKIVVFGEAKQGKSSLINMILGQAFSPVGESAPTTGTVVEFRRNDSELLAPRLFEPNECERRKKLLYESGKADCAVALDNLAENKQTDNGVSAENIAKYVDMQDGNKSFLRVKKLIVPVPKGIFPSAIFILTDTPAFNSTFKTNNESAINAVLEASRLVFVTSALHTVSDSEKQFLLNAVEHGNASDLIVVITHTDMLEDERVIENVKRAISAELEGVAEESRNLVKGVTFFAFSTAGSASKRKQKNSEEEAFARFKEMLFSDSDESVIDYNYIALLQKKRRELKETVRGRFKEQVESAEKNRDMLTLLKKTAGNCDTVTKKYLDQLNMRITSFYDDISADREQAQKYLDGIESEIMVKFDKIIDDGMKVPNYWKKDSWDKIIGLADPNAVLEKYEEKLKQEGAERVAKWQKRTDDFVADVSKIVGDFGNDFNDFKSTFSEINAEELLTTTGIATRASYAVSKIAEIVDKSLSSVKFLAGGAALAAPAAAMSLVLSNPGVALGAVALGLALNTGKAMGLFKPSAENFKKEKTDALKNALAERFQAYGATMGKFYQDLDNELWDNFFKQYYSEIKDIYSSNKNLLCQIGILERMTEDMLQYGGEVFELIDDAESGLLNLKTLEYRR